MDIGRKPSSSKSRMTLRKQSKKSLKVETQLAPRNPVKDKKKSSRGSRKFGTNLTNQPNLCESNLCQMINEDEFRGPETDVQPYLTEIRCHISAMDDKYTAILKGWIDNASNRQITPQMRSILIRWIIQVGEKFRVKPETIHICVQMIDYMLAAEGRSINKTNYQLLGIACLFVSSKYNEIILPEAQKFIFMCNGLYSCQQLFEMEAHILTTTQFNLEFPVVMNFAEHLSQEFNLSEGCKTLVRNLSNLCVLDFNLFNKYRKVQLATVVVYFALKIQGTQGIGSKDLMEKAGIDPSIFRQCLLILVSIYKENNKTPNQIHL